MNEETNLIYWMNEVGKEHNDIVGKKCANLGELYRHKFPVPYGFVVSLRCYEEFMRETGCGQKINSRINESDLNPDNLSDVARFKELSQRLRQIMEATRMPDYMQKHIGEYYQNMCEQSGIRDLPVAVRSAGVVSHPGQFETYLYVKGKENVIEHVQKKVWL